MKKNIIVFSIIIAISSHLNAMELQIAPCSFKNMPADIMDLIASFLTFDDIESEEEFIQRKKNGSSWPECSQNKRLNEKETQFSFLKNHINIANKKDIILFVYNSHDTICATKYLTTPVNAIQKQNVSIIDIKKNKELHNICLQQDFWNISKERHHQQGKNYGKLDNFLQWKYFRNYLYQICR